MSGGGKKKKDTTPTVEMEWFQHPITREWVEAPKGEPPDWGITPGEYSFGIGTMQPSLPGFIDQQAAQLQAGFGQNDFIQGLLNMYQPMTPVQFKPSVISSTYEPNVKPGTGKKKK